ncbi:MAG TPA: (2Fe-2S)-binding protein [Candidatus Dormibacteraeota bacterium]|jgi:carbon-monoxide dehydrogenase small subunit
MKRAVGVTVNGRAQDLSVDTRTLLVHMLREDLRLTSVHIGCTTGNCGACTVVLDGKTVKSCCVLAVDVAGSEVTTIEGLSTNPDELHPVQEAFIEKHGTQCGFCTPGMVLAAVSLLKSNPDPSEDEIRHGISGNLCRCTGYHNIVLSIEEAARRMRDDKPNAGSRRVASGSVPG